MAAGPSSRGRTQDASTSADDARAGLAIVEERDERADLLATIEGEIIPRLVLAHRDSASLAATCAEGRMPPTQSEIEEFARVTACDDFSDALAYVDTVCRQGLAIESVMTDLLAPAARLLGQQWKDDRRSFVEVTTGLGTLQRLVNVLGQSFVPEYPNRGLVVLVAAPGEQHTLGLYIVGEFIRRAGYGVLVSPNLSELELVRLLGAERVLALGVSVSSEELLPSLSRFIATMRKASCNDGLAVLVGGNLDLREFAERNGAVLSPNDPKEAVRWLDQHVSE